MSSMRIGRGAAAANAPRITAERWPSYWANKHAVAMSRGATWARDLFNLVRVPVQAPLVGVPRLSPAAQGAHTASWGRTFLHEGALGALRRSTRYAAGAGGALAGALAGACGANEGQARAVERRTAQGLTSMLVVPITYARRAIIHAGGALADTASTLGALVGLAAAFPTGAFQRRSGLQAVPMGESHHDAAAPACAAEPAPTPMATRESMPGAAPAHTLTQDMANSLAAEVRPHVVQQLGAGVPDLSNIELCLGSRRQRLHLPQTNLWSAARAAQSLHYAARSVKGFALRDLPKHGPAPLVVFPENLRADTYDDVRSVLHHEMVHLWQSARYPGFQDTATDDQDRARRRWVEGHAVYSQRQAERAVYPEVAPRPKPPFAWRLRLNPEIYDRMASAADDIYGKGLQVMQAVQARPDAPEVLRLAFSNPTLVDMLCGENARAEVALAPAFDTPHNRALVEALRPLNINQLRAL